MRKLAERWTIGLEREWNRAFVRFKDLERTFGLVQNRVENSAHLPGEHGGQVLYGGAASGESLTLHSNPSEDGLIKLGDNSAYDEATSRLGIGTLAPAHQIHVTTSGLIPTLYGSAASGGDLTLFSTSHATKGNIFFGTSTYDEANNRLGIKTTSPTVPLEVTAIAGLTMLVDGSQNNEIRAMVRNTDAANTGAVARVRASANDTALVDFNAHGASRVVTLYGITLASYGELRSDVGNGLLIGTGSAATPVVIGTNNAERVRITSAGDLGFGGSSFGSGAKVIFIANATTNPTTNPTGGGVLYATGGALTWRGSAGTVTTIAVA